MNEVESINVVESINKMESINEVRPNLDMGMKTYYHGDAYLCVELNYPSS